MKEGAPNSSESRIHQERGELDAISMHNDNLYDQNEDAAGERVDLATGLRIDNSSEVGNDEMLDIFIPEHETSTDALPPLEEEDDDAARFLREHDI